MRHRSVTAEGKLKVSKELVIRFSEIDMMNVVWHGAYALYFEDAREAFGAKYDLTYMGYVEHGYYAPIVEQAIQYKKPIRYGMRPRIDIIYRPTISAKVIFDYEIYDIDGLPRAWADSCPLRFIETADLSETVVPQCTPAYFTGDWVIDPQLQWELTDMAEYQIEINAEAEAQMEK